MINPTRSELQKIRKRKQLAQKGHTLLKTKQDVLTHEFMKKVDEYKDKYESTMKKLKKSYKTLTVDIAYAGIYVSRSVSYAMKPQFELAKEEKNIMGLKLPQLSATKKEVDNSYGNSPLLAESARSFRDLFEHLAELTNLKHTIIELSKEIKKLKRRVNSLEHIQIPRLEAIEKHIRFVLEEQERDSFIRLKTIKKRMESEG